MYGCMYFVRSTAGYVDPQKSCDVANLPWKPRHSQAVEGLERPHGTIGAIQGSASYRDAYQDLVDRHRWEPYVVSDMTKLQGIGNRRRWNTA
jgi:hypothetical protein